MRNRVQVSGVEETRARLPEILGAAHHEGAVTIVTRRGEPCAAVVPVSLALRDVPKLSESKAGRFTSRDEMRAFFVECDTLAGPEAEPEWEQHLAVIGRSRGHGTTDT